MTTVLVIDDSMLICSMVKNIFGAEHLEVATAQDAAQAFQWLDERTPDAILLDLVLPDMNGYEVCQRLQAREQLSDVPIIFLTSSHDEKSILQAFESGATDFITKPFSGAELKARVSCHLKNKLITEELRVAYSKLQQAMAELRMQGLKDPLTNLYNRRYFLENMSEWRMNFADENMYFVIIDIDNFKYFNDTYGHCAGDYVIYTVADLIVKCIGSDAVAGRWGGDEFLVVLWDCTEEKARALTQSMVDAVSSFRFQYDTNTFPCSITAGLSRFQPEFGIEQNIEGADAALYEAKSSGKNCYRFHESL